MIRAYDEKYLDDAVENLGEMTDYAVNGLGFDMDEFWELFIASGIAEKFGNGVPQIVSGKSGTELAMEIVEISGADTPMSETETEYALSTAYWCGWIIAYFQWYTGRTFKDIHRHISMAQINRMYPTLHEASEDKFVDTVNAIIQEQKWPTRLREQRDICNYTQRELSEKSGVNLRTLQQYELRAKDINKASGLTLLALSKTLSCKIEDLMEY